MSSSPPWPAAETVARLVSEAQGGTAASVDTLLSALRPGLVDFFGRRISRDIAEDLAQDALLRVTRALPSMEPDRAERLVVTIACNLLRTAYLQRAREKRRWAPEEAADTAGPPPAAERHAEYEQLARAVHQACAAKLSPCLQEVVLGLLRGETQMEVAERLQLRPVTVRTRLMRARSILRRELLPYFESRDLDTQDRTRMMG